MREILFRGKRKDNGEWIEGYYFRQLNPFSVDGSPIKHCISDLPPFGAEIVPETVGQYTGLTDKNGKRIFEGDILDCGDRMVCVEWHDRCGTWDSIFIKYIGDRCSNGIEPVEWKYRAVVIGNIHDNPELLK